MHETDPAQPSLADLQACWEAADAAVKAHARIGRRNDEIPPEGDAERQTWDAAGEAWSVEWDRRQAEARAAVVALHRGRQDGAEAPLKT